MNGTEAPFLTVVVPAYNEETNLAATVTVLLEHVASYAPSFEILIIDDASRDQTARIGDELAAADLKVRVVHHEVNKGIGGAFASGLRHARGEWLVLVPADLPLDPNELRRYLELAHDADIVVGIRSDKSDYTRFRRLVSWTNIRLIRILFGMPLEQFQYVSLYRRSVLDDVSVEYTGSAFFLAEVLIKAHAQGYRLRSLRVRYQPRPAGTATGATPSLILRTGRDMLRFWWRRDWRDRPTRIRVGARSP